MRVNRKRGERAPKRGGSPTKKMTKSPQHLPSEEEEYVEEEFTIAVLARDDGQPYGCAGFAPTWLQCCRRHPAALLSVLCILVIASAFIQYGVIPASTTQWQRRFQFSTFDLAMIRSMFDLGALIMVLPVIYYGEYGVHRAQWIGVGGIVVGVGAIIMVMPQFMIGPYHRLNSTLDLCNVTREVHRLHCTETWDTYKYMFMAGELLVGMGTAPHYVMGITYLDENVSHRQSGLYTAILEMCQLIGPIFGFLLTGESVNVWGDIDKDEAIPAGLDPKHHHWYGAWWLAMMGGAFLSWIGAALLFPFPAELSGAAVAHIRDVREAAMVTSGSGDSGDDALSDDRQFCKKLKKLFCNRVFIFAMIEECCRTAIAAGFFIFLPKYLEGAFETSAAVANFAVGSAVVPAALLALCFGTFVQFSFRFGVVENLRLCVAGAASALLFSFVLFVRCPSAEIAGVTVPYPEHKDVLLDVVCNRHCDCQTEDFDPVCFTPSGYDKADPYATRKKDLTPVTFFSKCFAGCYEEPFERDSLNCTCLLRNGTVTRNLCTVCGENMMYAFLIGLSWLAMSIYVRVNPTQQILLRCVPFKLRTVAMAVTSALIRTISIPSPFLGAYVFDHACRAWTTLCDRQRQKTCAWYDRAKLRNALLATSDTLGCVCLIAMIAALVLYKDPRVTKPAKSKAAKRSGSKSPDEKKTLAEKKDAGKVSPYITFP